MRGFLVYLLAWLVVEYRWWIVGGFAALLAVRLARRRIGSLHP